MELMRLGELEHREEKSEVKKKKERKSIGEPSSI
jgi:hypothetical protein